MTDQTYGRCFNDSDGFNDLLLVHLRARTVKISHNCGHASFVSHGGGQVDWLLGIVFGEALDLKTRLAVIVVIHAPIEFTLPRCLLARFLGKKAKEP